MLENQFFSEEGKWIENHSLHKSTTVYHKDMNELWQGFVVYTREIKTGLFKKEVIPFIFYCDVIFTSKEECAKVLPNYIKRLIEKEELPKEVIVDGKLNENIIKAGVRKLTMGMLDETAS